MKLIRAIIILFTEMKHIISLKKPVEISSFKPQLVFLLKFKKVYHNKGQKSLTDSIDFHVIHLAVIVRPIRYSRSLLSAVLCSPDLDSVGLKDTPDLHSAYYGFLAFSDPLYYSGTCVVRFYIVWFCIVRTFFWILRAHYARTYCSSKDTL